MNIKQGDIIIIELPFSNLSDSKMRPVLVLSNMTFNNQGRDIIVAKITGSKFDTSWETKLTNKNLKYGKLKKVSYVDSGFIFTIEKDLARKIIAKVDMHQLNVILKKVDNILTKG